MRYTGYTIVALFSFLSLASTQPEIEALKSKCSPRWGSDSATAVQNYSLYREYFKQKSYDDAWPFWRHAFLNSPAGSKRIHIDGIKLIQHKIKETRDPDYLDTMMMVFDQRIACFGQEGYVLGRKAIRMYQYKQHDPEVTLETFQKSVELEGNQTQYYVLPVYFNAAVRAMREEAITREEVLKVYGQIMDIIDHNVANNTEKRTKYEESQAQVDEALAKQGLIENCEDARSLYKARYEAEPDNPELWQSIFDLLKGTGCTKDPLFMEVTEKLNKKEPKANLAYFLARAKEEHGEYESAEQYYKQAVEMEDETGKEADYYLELAQLHYNHTKDFPTSRKYALKAAERREGWGRPYILIGDLYASSGDRCGPGTGFKSQVVIWPAMDMYEKAKKVDPDMAEMANKRLNRYHQYMPSKEDIFMHLSGDAIGSSYTVECWINETTTVRSSD